MWLLRHIKLLICLNASIRRTQFCMALNSYKFYQKSCCALTAQQLFLLRMKLSFLTGQLFGVINYAALTDHIYDSERRFQDTVLKCETRCLEELYHSCDLIARVAIHKKYRKRGMSI